MLAHAFNMVMKPVDWVVEQTVPPHLVDQAGEAIEQFLATLNDATKWTVDVDAVMTRFRSRGIDIENIEDLRTQPMDQLDVLAQSCFAQNTVLAALSGGGAGLGGAVLIAADIPLLFMINFRMIQQIGASYGFSMKSPEYSSLVVSIFNAAVSNERIARSTALREISVAASAFASGSSYKGLIKGTFPDQSRHIPREIAKNIVGRKLLQTIPLAGAVVGAGINYWFTDQTARTAYMLFRALYLDYKERM